MPFFLFYVCLSSSIFCGTQNEFSAMKWSLYSKVVHFVGFVKVLEILEGACIQMFFHGLKSACSLHKMLDM